MATSRIPSRVIAFIMAGGMGDRLSVLSEQRAKPAVPFGGSYRIIDFVLSNCVNSGITRVGVLTQYLPRSLNEHIASGGPWGLDRDAPEGVSILQPYQSRHTEWDWYTGTADAVYQNLFALRDYNADTVLVLAGDHVYATDYRPMLDFHRERDADVTLGITDVPIEDASRFGLVTIDGDDRVRAFVEKPEHPTSTRASMGFYAFKAGFLVDILIADAEDERSGHDFGHDVLQRAIAEEAKIYGFPFEGYWRDIGTVEAYWTSSMELLDDPPPVDFDQPGRRILTRGHKLPSARFGPSAEVRQAMVGSGSVIHGTVEHSVLSPGVVVEAGAVVRDSVLLNGVRVESGAIVERSIVDKQVNIGWGARVGTGDDFTPNLERPDLIWSGVNIIGKRAQVPPRFEILRNTVIGPLVAEELRNKASLPVGSTVRSPRVNDPLSI